jgi:hypothetical protein
MQGLGWLLKCLENKGNAEDLLRQRNVSYFVQSSVGLLVLTEAGKV